MAPGSCACRSPHVNTPVDPARELDELDNAQAPTRRSNTGSNKAPTKAPTSLEAPTPPLVPLPTEDLFTIFMKVFMEKIQAQALAEPQERPL